MMRWLALAMLSLAAVASAESLSPRIAYSVLASYPHDRNAFTQGLLFYQGRLYESTGLRGHSEVRVVELESGRVLKRVRLNAQLFGEGLARVNQRLFQLTWTSGEGFVYEASNLTAAGRFRYRGEGWGLAYDGKVLWKSNGTATLERVSPIGFRVLSTLRVTQDGEPVKHLNELEFVNGALFANVWLTDVIVRIDPITGKVTGHLDLSQLLSPMERLRADVLNGIAWDGASRRLLVTGKHWPKLFALELKEDIP